MEISDDAWLIRSRYAHVVRLESGNYLCVNAMARTRIVVRAAVAAIARDFRKPRQLGDWLKAYARRTNGDPELARPVIRKLVEERILFRGTRTEEDASVRERLSTFFDRDPQASLERWERATESGPRNAGWVVSVPRGIESFEALPHRLEAIVIGCCEVQMELDFLREAARGHGIELNVAATFQHDVELVAERVHDFVIIGALDERHAMLSARGDATRAPHHAYVEAARTLIERLRARTRAPILIDNMPIPTCSALGLADRGLTAHRERCRQANLGLTELAASMEDVYVVDIEAAFARFGSLRLLDDSVQSFCHLGSLRWIEQRPASEKRAVHGIFPPMELLNAFGSADTYDHERVLATEHIGLMVAIRGIGRRKCVVVDLDDTLWPGVLADTQAPFALHAVTGQYSYIGLYFGLHEALKALSARGILLACVSKNDEAVVRSLWKYGPEYPVERLLTLDDFVAHRINWNEKVDNLRELAAELNLGLDAFVFIDDNPIEREKVNRYLPSVRVMGDNPFTLRYELLTDPQLQVPTITDEAHGRAAGVKAAVAREQARRSSINQEAFLPSLELRCEVARLTSASDLDRPHELVLRTNQFNTTTRRYARQELEAIVARAGGRVYSLRVRDRFADHGLVGVCVVEDGTLELFVMSCRVMGLGVEDVFLRTVMRDLRARHASVDGLLVSSDRNLPCRNLFRANGFYEAGDGRWRADLSRAGGDIVGPYYALTTQNIESEDAQ